MKTLIAPGLVCALILLTGCEPPRSAEAIRLERENEALKAQLDANANPAATQPAVNGGEAGNAQAAEEIERLNAALDSARRDVGALREKLAEVK